MESHSVFPSRVGAESWRQPCTPVSFYQASKGRLHAPTESGCRGPWNSKVVSILLRLMLSRGHCLFEGMADRREKEIEKQWTPAILQRKVVQWNWSSQHLAGKLNPGFRYPALPNQDQDAHIILHDNVISHCAVNRQKKDHWNEDQVENLTLPSVFVNTWARQGPNLGLAC